MPRPTSTYPTVHKTLEDRMRFKHAGRARAAVAVAATVALTAAAPAAAQVQTGVDQTGVAAHPRHGEAVGVERGTGQFRARYQLRLSEARAIVVR